MFLPRLSLLSCALLCLSGCATAADKTPLVPAALFAPHIAKFNTMEPETVVNAVPNAEAQTWLEANVPRFACPDPQLEETYWFRWWALRKHLRRDEGTGRWVFTEFITRARPVSSALGHDLMEGRWLREQLWHDDYVLFWLRGGKDGQPEERFHRYSQWMHHALWSRWLVTQDTATLTGLLDELVADYRRWETERVRPDGLFWQADVWDAIHLEVYGVAPETRDWTVGTHVAAAVQQRVKGIQADECPAGVAEPHAERFAVPDVATMRSAKVG